MLPLLPFAALDLFYAIHRSYFDSVARPLPSESSSSSSVDDGLPTNNPLSIFSPGQHEVLASGPVEDLIAHREHRYRISGTSLFAAMDLSSHVPYSDVLSVHTGEISPPNDDQEQMDWPQFQDKNENLLRADDRSERVHPTVDVAEILRRWIHALQCIHKQSLNLAKANDGEGPELLRSTFDTSTSGHAESLVATLTEHQQHLVSIQGLINQLTEAIPAMQRSISELTEEVMKK